jgi:hypothetical protein
MLIMVVFDPLAVLLLIAANMSLQQRRGKPIVEDNTVVALTPETESFKIHKKFWKKKEKKANTEMDIPVFTEQEELANNVIKIEKENITEIEEKPVEDIVIDVASGESIPPITKGKRGFPNRKSKELTPKYDYEDEFAFREKEKK